MIEKLTVDIRVPKGTKDYSPTECALRSNVIEKIRSIYQRSGASEIETPIFELRSVLTSKYGEEATKLIYDLADQGGDLCSLRYDLTVPFVRYLATNRITKIKRFQIGKVFRRDNPSIKQGRLREFLQCDFDIVGSSYEKSLAELETLSILHEQLSSLDLSDFKIRLNSRVFLELIVLKSLDEEHLKEIFDSLGSSNSISPSSLLSSVNFESICSTVDKLDKETFDSLRSEFLSKGLNKNEIQSLKKILYEQNALDQVSELLSSFAFPSEETGTSEVLEYFKSRVSSELTDFFFLFASFSQLKINDFFVFDLTLSRGLDYYTGLIFEAIVLPSKKHKCSIGSIAGGGRYDNLISSFTEKQTPAVGFSLGVDRILTILKERNSQLGKCEVKSVFVVGINIPFIEKMKVKRFLVGKGFKVDYFIDEKGGVKRQVDAGIKGFDFLVVIGKKELEKGEYNIKDVAKRSEITVGSLEGIVNVLNGF